MHTHMHHMCPAKKRQRIPGEQRTGRGQICEVNRKRRFGFAQRSTGDPWDIKNWKILQVYMYTYLVSSSTNVRKARHLSSAHPTVCATTDDPSVVVLGCSCAVVRSRNHLRASKLERMLKSQAPSRLKQVKGRLALPSIKRHKTSTTPLGRSSTQISTETAGTGQLPPSADASAIVQGRWFAPAPVEVSVDRREAGIEPQPQQQQTSCGWQDQRFQNKNKNASSSTADSSNVRPGNTTAANGSKAAVSCSSAAAPGASTASPTKHVKTKGQKRVAAAAAATKASGNVHIEWRVPSPSTNLPYRDTGANSSSHSSRMVRRRAQAGSPTAKRLPTQQYDRRNSSSGAPRRSNSSGSSKARSSGSTSRTGLSSSPLKKKESSAVVAPKKGEKDEEAKRKEEGEEGERELPPCPYPGHKNVSWTCRGCGGARHHLTSRSAMEPLQRVHGFKVGQGWISQTSRFLFQQSLVRQMVCRSSQAW